jgi:hypothetical protein
MVRNNIIKNNKNFGCIIANVGGFGMETRFPSKKLILEKGIKI